MQFQRLRLSGFKSFVEPTEFRIEPGLTAVVGPNGCGKSNLLEALRWVMGATSAKAMRGEAMDDVIFGGAGDRPSRNRAEVLLQIDNTDRTAPAQFNDSSVIEVVRRIDRGSGSAYRINGVEARARDVQLLFADASTGANSPALVRQGQISELIGAKPSNRRRILEEAAGVSGLHTRRHEADLRLRAAEANLARLEDVNAELEAAHNRLRREARQAEKYRRLSAEIRALQGAALLARWREAKGALAEAEADSARAEAAVAAATIESARLTTFALTTSEALKPLREEEAVAAAVLQRLIIERDRLERDAAQAAAEVERLKTDLVRIGHDQARERQSADDAAASLSRAQRDLADVERLIAAAPTREPELAAALDLASAARAAADAEVERLAAEAAADAARRQALRARIEEMRVGAETALRRRDEAEARLSRAHQSRAAAEAEHAGLAAPAEDAGAARAALVAASAELQNARAAVADAEAVRTAAQSAESAARDAARTADDRLRQLRTEAAGLDRLLEGGKPQPYPPALDAVRVEPGYEAAVASAFGEDLDAALDARATAFWAGAEVGLPVWPPGVEPLSRHVTAPAPLAARVAMTGLTTRDDAERLRAALPVGARLVTREGDLWRWDGLVVRAEAPRPAAKRLEQRARRTALDTEIGSASPKAEMGLAAHKDAEARVRDAEDALREARRRPEAAERALAHARDAAERQARDETRREARLQAVNETLARLTAEIGEAESALATAMAEAMTATETLATTENSAPAEADARQSPVLGAARTISAEAREAESRARGVLDQEGRAREGRQRRREGLLRDVADWTRRHNDAEARIVALEADRVRADAALNTARAAPDEVAVRTQRLLGEFAQADARRSKAADVLAAADAAATEADRAARAAEREAAAAREHRAAELARREAASERLEAVTDQVRQTTRLEPEALERSLKDEAVAVPTGAQGIDTHLAALERERDGLGAVNLLAENEAAEHAQRLETMREERADLAGAVSKLRAAIEELNGEGRERLLAAFGVINEGFKTLFQTLFEGGEAELRLVESDDPLEAGLEIFACPPGKRMAIMSLMSGGEQALTATALIFAVFLANPAPICVLDEVDAPLDDANVDRFCRMLDEMRRRTETRFIAITHNPVTMSRMDRLYGVTMAERGVSQLVSVDLRQAEAMVA